MESLHPLIVHFPIALLLTATALELASLACRRPGWHRIALWNLALGTLGAAAAVASGLYAERVARHSFEIWEVMERHERLGISTLILALMAVAWRLKQHDQLSPRARLTTTLLNLAMTGTLVWGAYLGGRLVYELGVGGGFGR